MENYERQIGLKTIYLTLIRRFIFIFVIFIPVAIASFVVTQKLLPVSYQSSVTYKNGNGNAITTAHHSNMQTFLRDTVVISEEQKAENPSYQSGAVTKAVNKLNEQNITIDAAAINSGLTFGSFTNNATSFTVTFTTNTNGIADKVLQALVDAVKENISEGYTGTSKIDAAYKNFNASNASAASSAASVKKNRNYLLIALAAGLVLALGVPFVYEIVSDEVYDRKDIEGLGSDSFELAASK